METWLINRLPGTYRKTSVPYAAHAKNATPSPASMAGWDRIGGVEVVGFETALRDADFERRTTGDYHAQSDGRCVVATVGGTMGYQDLPANFFEAAIFPLDTRDEAAVAGFIERYGMCYSPYGGSKDLLLDRWYPADARRPRGLAGRIGDVWTRIARWRARTDFIDLGDGFSKRLEGPALESAGMRIELAKRGVVDLVRQRVVSLAEAALSLELFRESAALLLAHNVSGGAWGPAISVLLRYGVVPRLLLPEEDDLGSMRADELLELDEKKKGAVSERLFLGLQGLLPDCLKLVNAYLSLSGGDMADGAAVCGRDFGDAWRESCAKLFPAGPLEAAARLLVDICTDEAPWRFCAECGRPYKRTYRYGDTCTTAKKSRASEFCGSACQKRHSRRTEREAKEVATELLREHWGTLSEKGEEGSRTLFADIAGLASRRCPHVYAGRPGITPAKVKGLYSEMVRRGAESDR